MKKEKQDKKLKKLRRKQQELFDKLLKEHNEKIMNSRGYFGCLETKQ